MRKKLGMLVAILSLSVLAQGASVNKVAQPANVGGVSPAGSFVDLEIFANVVDSVAVNQASPIDFGNLRRGMFGQHDALHKGKLLVDAGSETVELSFAETTGINLIWNEDNGTTGDGTRDQLENITLAAAFGTGADAKKITGITGDGQVREIGASFMAAAGGNLDNTQKLGLYKQSVRVTATVTPTP